MQFQTNLVRRHSHFYFRSRVPKDLKSHYGKSEILVSLKTSDKRVAEYELAKIKVKIYGDFARLRGESFGIVLTPDIETPALEYNLPTVQHSGSTDQHSTNTNRHSSATDLHSADTASSHANSTAQVQYGASVGSAAVGPTIEIIFY